MFNSPPTWIEISQKAFEHNITQYKNIVGNSVNIALVVKSNAYGHGLAIITQLCKKNPNVDWLCVSNLSEAIGLREHGMTKPILVMGVIDADPLMAIHHNIDLVAFDAATIAELNERASLLGKSLSIHLKIDTGLARFGLLPQEATVQEITQIVGLPHIALRGIFSHFSEADGDDIAYSDAQQEQFIKIINELEHAGISIPYKHMSNSAGASSLVNSHFNLVRIGAGAYGLQPSPATMERSKKMYPTFDLQAIMTWKTHLMHIRTVPANSYVGYSRTHKTNATTRIGIMPIGYYDGYDRRLSNNGIVLIQSMRNGIVIHNYAPVIGKVCMNVTMIDITNLDVCVGDEIILLGNYPKLQAHDMANAIQSFNPREITTRLNPVLHRILMPADQKNVKDILHLPLNQQGISL